MSPLHQSLIPAKTGFLELLSKTAIDYDPRELKHQSNRGLENSNDQVSFQDQIPCSDLQLLELNSTEKSCVNEFGIRSPSTSNQLLHANSPKLNMPLSRDMADNRKRESVSPIISQVRPSDPTEYKDCSCSSHVASKSYVTNLIRENVDLKIELGEARKKINLLLHELNRSSCNIRELRLLSEGSKISDIPVADMIDIMKEYGSEVSSKRYLQARKENPQPASIIRQFRRWNPNFFQYFERQNGVWVPKLGKAQELQRRQRTRNVLRHHRQNPPNASSSLTINKQGR
jgi:hypothetical protein